ncbi:hypothetical protein [Sphingomonas montana]|uniref:hypothetical protein n=1 Tax=Sphingomonas montana TaxID=1843236 RepID=UPI00101AD4A6|nr:hypothetical protein [Sphingomonas montana]
MESFPPIPLGHAILIATADGSHAARPVMLLADRGWILTTVTDGAAAVAHAATRDYDLLWLLGDLSGPDGASLAMRIRRLPPPRGALPVLTTASGDPPPSDAALHARIAGASRSGVAPPDPVARLAPLVGAAGVAALMTRFRARLAAVLTADDPCAVDEGRTIATLAHRIAGIAGTLDFPLLAAAWQRVERDGPAHLPDAWLETRIARATLDILLDRGTAG